MHLPSYLLNPLKTPIRSALIITLTVTAIYTSTQLSTNYPWSLTLQILTLITGSALLYAPTYPNTALSITAICLYLPLLISPYQPDLLESSINSIGTLGATSYAAFIAPAYTSAQKQRLWATALIIGSSLGCLYEWKLPSHNTPTQSTTPTLEYLALITAIAWISLGFFWLLGTTYKQHRRSQQTMHARAEMSAILERTRIAREMHDIIAHSLSGIIAQADGARYASHTDREEVRQALDTISTSARQSLKEMRGLLTLLRSEEPREENSPPTTENIHALIENAQNNGLILEITGLDSIPEDLSELAQFTLYRIIQEILTNMLKYSSPQQGTILFQTTSRDITITSTNPVAPSPTPNHQQGYGLVGIQERLQAQQGTLTFRNSSADFFLCARLPR